MKDQMKSVGFAPTRGNVAAVLMAAFVAVMSTGSAAQIYAKSQDSILLELSRDGDIVQVTKADGTPIPPMGSDFKPPNITMGRVFLYDSKSRYIWDPIKGVWICILM